MRVEAQISCARCGTVFNASLFRTLWIEHVAYRDLVFGDEVNVVECPDCQKRICLPFSLLCTNVTRDFAVWYEPFPDENVDRDIEGYAKLFGPDSYYATAPRVKNWNEFKRTILKFESGELRGNPIQTPAGQTPADEPSAPSAPVQEPGFFDRLRRAIGGR